MAVTSKATGIRATIAQTAEMPALAVAALVLLLIAILSYRDSAVFGRVREQMDISQQIAQTTSNLLSTLTDAETRQRQFLLTWRESYLDPYHRAVSNVSQILNSLTRLS